MTSTAYRGRFAPSPTGPLHFGSLVAAVASFADARHEKGEWLVRVEDVDGTRSRPDAEARILQTLQTFGMYWDRPIVRQSDRVAFYQSALDSLVRSGYAYRCNCSRKTVAATAHIGTEGPIYSGICRSDPPPPDAPAAWRAAVTRETISFGDRVVGVLRQNIARDIGDFVVRRIDGYTAYQLAVVVDDFEQGITDVVRGADLLWSTPRQVLLQRRLGYSMPRYAHIPLVYAADGRKLSKRDEAHPVDARNPVQGLTAAWSHLGQVAPTERFCSSEAFWEWAIPRWDIARVPREKPTGYERSSDAS